MESISFATQDDGSTLASRSTRRTAADPSGPGAGSNDPDHSRARHWQFTINNYSDADEQILRDLSERDGSPVSYLIYGKEVGASGTPHLQGHVSFKQQTWFSTVQTELPPGTHLEVVRLLQRHIDYCKKDGSFTEYGTPPTREASKQGTRADLDEFRRTVSSGVYDGPTLREKHPVVMARYPVFARSVVDDLRPKPKVPDHPLRDWQQSVVDAVHEQPDPRSILFVVDERGDQGKSFLADYLQERHQNVLVLEPGKLADLAYVYEPGTEILIVDVPRSRTKYLDYSFLESIKNGRLFCTKYESRMIRFRPPHVIVFMNEHPDPNALSADRYKYILIR